MHRGRPAALAALPLAAGLALVAVPAAHAAARQPAAVTWQDTAVQASGSYQHAITGKATFVGTGSVTGITGLTTPTSWSATFGGTLTGVSIGQADRSVHARDRSIRDGPDHREGNGRLSKTSPWSPSRPKPPAAS